MKAPMSPEIAKILQDPRTAHEIMGKVLQSRTAAGQQPITIVKDGKTLHYKSVAGIQRTKTR